MGLEAMTVMTIPVPAETSVLVPVETSVPVPAETSVTVPTETSVPVSTETSIPICVETIVSVPVKTLPQPKPYHKKKIATTTLRYNLHPYERLMNDARYFFCSAPSIYYEGIEAQVLAGIRDAARREGHRRNSYFPAGFGSICREETATLPDGTTYQLTATWIPDPMMRSSSEIGTQAGASRMQDGSCSCDCHCKAKKDQETQVEIIKSALSLY